MEFRVPQPVKTITVAALLGYGALVFQQLDDFDITSPKPVLNAKLAYAGGTATIGEGGYHSGPPNAPIEVKNRKFIGGAAIPGS